MNDIETVIFETLYREGFSKAGSSGKITEHLAKVIAAEVDAHFAFVRRGDAPRSDMGCFRVPVDLRNR